MDTHSIIKQLTDQLSNHPVEQERISHLGPIEIVLLNINKDIKIKMDEKYTFLCVPALEKKEGKDDADYDDIDYLKITDKRLYELLQEHGKNNINDFIEYLNKEIFHHIQGEVKKAKDMEAWDINNMWYKPNRRFVQWFQMKNIDPESRVYKKVSDDSLWAIADDMRERKKEGEFKSFREAYRWAEKNKSTFNVPNITAKKLERAYHKAKSEGRVGEKKTSKVSIPIMITNKMRMDLLTLGWSKDEMKHLTPKKCWEIIDKGVPKKPSRERGRNQ